MLSRKAVLTCQKYELHEIKERMENQLYESLNSDNPSNRVRMDDLIKEIEIISAEITNIDQIIARFEQNTSNNPINQSINNVNNNQILNEPEIEDMEIEEINNILNNNQNNNQNNNNETNRRNNDENNENNEEIEMETDRQSSNNLVASRENRRRMRTMPIMNVFSNFNEQENIQPVVLELPEVPMNRRRRPRENMEQHTRNLMRELLHIVLTNGEPINYDDNQTDEDYERYVDLEDVKLPIKKEILKKIPIKLYEEIDIIDKKEKNIQCAVCLTDFENKDKVRNLPCHHVYHNDCITEWFHNNASCPVCKHNLNDKKIPKIKMNKPLSH